MGQGIEKLLNTSFDNGDNWTLYSGGTISGNKLNIDTNLTYSPRAQTPMVLDVGKNFRLNIIASDYTEGTIRFEEGAGQNLQEVSGAGETNFDFTADGAGTNFLTLGSRAGGTDMSFDYISVKEILPDPTIGTLSLGATGGTTQELTWTAANVNGGSAIAGYDIYKDGVLEKSVGNVLSDTVTGLTASTEYDWTIKAINSDDTAGESAFSNEVTATTDAATTTVEVEWIDSISAAATGNKIYRDDVEIADIGMGVQTYNDTEAPTASNPKYEVQAYDAEGNETTQEVTGVNTNIITTA